MTKTEVYSWRVAPALKGDLESAAREKGLSVAGLLDQISRAWLAELSRGADEEAEQERIRAQVLPLIGSVTGEDPERSSEVSQRVRAILLEKHAASRPD